MLMSFNRKRKKGQSTLEYAILIVIIIGALMSIQYYIKRGVQGRWKSNTDDIGDQFSPGNTNVHRLTTTYSDSTETIEITGQTSTILHDEQRDINLTSNILNANFEYFGGS